MVAKIENPTPPPAFDVRTIPPDFYAGANPTIKFKNVEKVLSVGGQTASPSEMALLDKSTVAGGGKWWHPANLFTNGKFFLVAAIVSFLIFIGAASIYYYLQSRQNGSTALSTPALPVAAQIQTVTPTATPIVAEPTTSQPATSSETATQPEQKPLSLSEAPIDFPSMMLSDGSDLDNDGLSDAEEELFGVDPSVADTDGDSYRDGLEVENLYNPNGEAPMKLIDSGTVINYTNPNFGYELYYPKGWAVGNVDNEYRQVLFSTLTGDNIEVRVFDLPSGETFADWFGKWAPGEKFSDLKEFTNPFKVKGWRRSDFLVNYFNDSQKIFVIVYHTTDSETVNFRAVIKTMASSFRPAGNEASIPPQPRIIEGDGLGVKNTSSTLTHPATSSL